ncbi:MAG TPA: winged helix DNA-binding domain-containing protein [Herpetosiphonaceae bacterium]
MIMTDIGVQRLKSQRVMPPTFTSAAEVVRWLGAVQAQDFLGSLWAIGSRMQDATEQMIEQAIAERTIVRTWPMRGTVHFVPAEDARWMLNLLTPRVVSRSQSIYRQLGLDQAVMARSHDVVTRALSGGKTLRRNDLYAELEAAGIATGDMRGLHIIGQLAQAALICFGPRSGKQPTFTLLDEWAPNQRALSGEEAIAELVVRYFRSHGPATIHDFMWWTGLTMAEARPAIEAMQSQLVGETIDGKTYWWTDDTPGVEPHSPALYLLPPFDEYLVSYKDRSPSLEPANTFVAAPDRHLGSIIVIDGRVVGLWKRTFKKDTVTIEATCGRDLTEAEIEAFEAAARRYAAFVGMPTLHTSIKSSVAGA